MHLPILTLFLCAYIACVAAWPFPGAGAKPRTPVCGSDTCPNSGTPASSFTETRFFTNAERLKLGLPLLKPTKRRPGVSSIIQSWPPVHLQCAMIALRVRNMRNNREQQLTIHDSNATIFQQIGGYR
ncbi:hypothetical protein B0H19DRAFT_1067317 [Mycena capillaripes]|nr:hypothetical protein B0H19DRAFT_1067317 [Mycena capillaripes]